MYVHKYVSRLLYSYYRFHNPCCLATQIPHTEYHPPHQYSHPPMMAQSRANESAIKNSWVLYGLEYWHSHAASKRKKSQREFLQTTNADYADYDCLLHLKVPVRSLNSWEIATQNFPGRFLCLNTSATPIPLLDATPSYPYLRNRF